MSRFIQYLKNIWNDVPCNERMISTTYYRIQTYCCKIQGHYGMHRTRNGIMFRDTYTFKRPPLIIVDDIIKEEE